MSTIEVTMQNAGQLCKKIGIDNILQAAQYEAKRREKPKFVYTDEKTAIEVLGGAIKKFLNEGKSGCKRQFEVGEIAKIISDGFLNDILVEEDKLINHNRKVIQFIEQDKDKLIRECAELEAKIREKQSQYDEIKERIAKYEGKEIYKETDPALVGAMNAYYFILDATGDKEKAAKAFNSYLIGGKQTDEGNYSEFVKDGKIVQKVITGEREKSYKPKRANTSFDF